MTSYQRLLKEQISATIKAEKARIGRTGHVRAHQKTQRDLMLEMLKAETAPAQMELGVAA